MSVLVRVREELAHQLKPKTMKRRDIQKDTKALVFLPTRSGVQPDGTFTDVLEEIGFARERK